MHDEGDCKSQGPAHLEEMRSLCQKDISIMAAILGLRVSGLTTALYPLRPPLET